LGDRKYEQEDRDRRKRLNAERDFGQHNPESAEDERESVVGL
jgi:hypothetical protein